MSKTLQIDKAVDKHLKPVKDSDGTQTALEISTEAVKVKDLVVSGTTTGISASDDTKLPLAGGTMTGDITMTADEKVVLGDAGEYIVGDGDDLSIVSSRDVTVDADRTIKLQADTNVTMEDGTNVIFDFNTDEPALTIQDDADANDYFKIAVAANGETTITTVDDGAALAHLSLLADGNIALLCNPTGKIQALENDGSTYTPNHVDSITTKAYVDAKVIQVATGTLSTADMNALHTTEQVLVAAQGAGKLIIPIGLSLLVDRAATQTSSTANLALAYDGGATSYGFGSIRRFMWNELGDRQLGLFVAPYEPSQNLTDGQDAPLTLKLSAATTTDCFTSVQWHLTYTVWEL